MNKLVFLLFLLTGTVSIAQTFPPEPGAAGSTAIHRDSSCFVAWADGGSIYRGYIDINDTTATYSGSNRATFGELSYAFGPSQGTTTNVVSLGDSGYVTLTFPQYIIDGPGWDFAVFENGFDDHYMELGHVEISSDGVHFFRFPSTSEIPLDGQLSNSSYSNCGYVDNLAGKYKVGYGTPFDISQVADDALLNKNAITHIRIVDVIGAITGIGTTDQYGTVINDPYPTAFPSGGFDLDAIGIINGTLGIEELHLNAQLYPNPTSGKLTIQLMQQCDAQLFGIDGKLIWQAEAIDHAELDLKAMGLEPGTYQVVIRSGNGMACERVVVF